MKKISILFALVAILSQVTIAQSTIIKDDRTGNIPHSLNRDASCDTIFSFSYPGLNPTGLAFDGTYLWCNNFYAPHLLFRFDLMGQFIDSIASPALDAATAGGMDFDGTQILLCVEQDGILYKLDPVTGAVVAQFNLPHDGSSSSDANNFGIAFDGTYLWHTEYGTSSNGASTLYKLDATTGAVLESFLLAGTDLEIKFIHGSLYGIDPLLEMVHKIDTTNGNYLSSEPWCIGYTLGFTVAGNHLWAGKVDDILFNTGKIYQFDSQFLSATQTAIPEITCSMYPNPVSDWLRVELGDVPDSKLCIEIGNVTGQNKMLLLDQQTVSSEQQFDFDLSGLPTGVYMVKIKSAAAQSFKVLVKQ